MTNIRIKICGITRVEDALVAAQLGVDALGFIFVKKSPRYISPEAATRIIAELPPFISRVGVFADEEYSYVHSILKDTGIDTVQLHGSESVEYCRKFTCPTIKSFGLRPDFAIGVLEHYPIAGILLDTWNEGLVGGSGIVGDWVLARKIADRYEKVILAGGLGPSNIETAITAVQPYGVDLNSGVEIKPGVKNLHKMRDVVRIIRSLQSSVQ